MEEGLRVNSRVTIGLGELRWRFSRSGGPGGQSVNTADSRVELSFDLANSPSVPPYLRGRAIERLGEQLVKGVLTVAASDSRSQLQNRRAAERRLVDKLAAAMAPPPAKRRATKPTRSSQRERVDTKRHRGEIKKNRRPPSDD